MKFSPVEYSQIGNLNKRLNQHLIINYIFIQSKCKILEGEQAKLNIYKNLIYV